MPFPSGTRLAGGGGGTTDQDGCGSRNGVPPNLGAPPSPGAVAGTRSATTGTQASAPARRTYSRCRA